MVELHRRDHLEVVLISRDILCSPELGVGATVTVQVPTLPKYSLEVQRAQSGFELSYRPKSLLSCRTQAML
jgi:hypothetical protein